MSNQTEEQSYDPVFDKIFPSGSTETMRLICKTNLYLSFGGYGGEAEDLPLALARADIGDNQTWVHAMFDKVRELDVSGEVDFSNMDMYELKT